jgi:ketosteroid isomerase-like protein
MHMNTPEHSDDAFFAALLAADADALDQLLAQDFLIVDVARGGVTSRDEFVAAVRSAMVRFVEIAVAERTTRGYGNTAVIVGRTMMQVTIGGTPEALASRYTHVLVRDGEVWRLASAQGTQIAEAA